jgi:ribonuclease J
MIVSNRSVNKRPHLRVGQNNIQQRKPLVGNVKNSDFNKLKIIPLGGNEEVGRNMTVFEYNNDIVILDMGLQFPEEDMPGIDYIVPNVSYLKGKEKNIKAVIFSHGHLDHIGAAPILLEQLGSPVIVGMKLTLAMVKNRQEDYKKGTAKNLKTITINKLTDRFTFGSFKVGFFQIEHSIMDAVGVIISTPVATVIHSGDWTMERDANNRPLIDYSPLSKLPSPKVLMLESLGAINNKASATSQEMKQNLFNIIRQAQGRIVIGTFSSQIERVGWIIAMAERLNKRVALDGYSMRTNIEIAKKLGYIKSKKETLIRIDEIDNYDDNRVVVICTGAQGEENAVLMRIISGGHKIIKLKKSDTVVLSSSIIPGNERTIQRLKDSLYRQCDNVIHGSIMDVHVSGHGNQEDIKTILQLVKPDYYLPVYANHYMLKEAQKLAQSNGFNPKKIFVADNGQVVEFSKLGGRLSDKKVPTDYVFVDGLGVGDISHVVLRDRQMMAQDGMIVVIATIDGKTGQLIQSPDLISRGFIYMKENKKLVEETRDKVKQLLKDYNPGSQASEVYIKNRIRNELGSFLFQKTERRPMVLPVLIEV